MISLDKIQEITNLVKSRALSALQSLSTQADLYRQQFQIITEQVAVLGDIAQFADGSAGDLESLSSSSLTFIQNLISEGKELVFNTGLDQIMRITFVSGGDEIRVMIDNVTALSIDTVNLTIRLISGAVREQLLLIEQIARNNSLTAGMYFAFADIADMASQTDWTIDANLAAGLYTKIQEYESVLGAYVTDIISAVSRGPLALLQCFTGLIEKVNEKLNNGDLESLMNSTNITLNHFSWGIIATTIGAVVTAISTVVACVSRIAGAVLAVAGVILSVVGRIVTSATTAFDDTQYKVRAGSDVIHVFSFVIDQGVKDLSGTAEYMRSRGWMTMTVICPFQATVYMMYLEDFDSSTNNNIHYEAHLSSDIDISGLITETIIDNGNNYFPYYGPSEHTGSTKPCGIGFLPSYTGSDEYGTFTSLPLNIINAYGSGTLTSPATSLRNYFSDEELLHPSDFSILDTLKQWYNNDLTNFLDVRLCSALIVYCSFNLLNFWSNWNVMPGSIRQNMAMNLRIYPTTVQENNCAVMLLSALYRDAWYCFVNTESISYVGHRLKSNGYGLTTSQRDTLLSDIKTCFDQLRFKTKVLDHDLPAKVFKVHTSTETGNIAFTHIGTSNQDITVSRMADIVESKIYAMAKPGGLRPQFTSGQWINSFAIDLPTLTFDGFIAGLIVDGLLLTFIAATAAVAVVGWVKIRDKASQLAGQAEGKWYAYQADPSKQNWKAYNRARLKYNLVAICTGGTTMKKNPYQDTTANDTIHSLKGFTSTETEPTIGDVVKLIRGE